MVATRRNNPGVFEKPITLKVAGEDKVLTNTDAVVDFLRKLERDVISLNIRHAKAKFYLGQVLIQAAEVLGHGHINHFYNECGINARRAQQAIGFAMSLANTDGDFCIEKFRMWERKTLKLRDDGVIKCRVDSNGTPSVSAFERAMGIRSKKESKNEQVFVFENPEQTASSDRPVGTKTQTNPPVFRMPGEVLAPLMPAAAAVPADPDSPRGAGGGQMAIDFDLIAAERQLADLIKLAQRRIDHDDLSSAHAEQIHATLEHAAHHTRTILQTAKG